MHSRLSCTGSPSCPGEDYTTSWHLLKSKISTLLLQKDMLLVNQKLTNVAVEKSHYAASNSTGITLLNRHGAQGKACLFYIN